MARKPKPTPAADAADTQPETPLESKLDNNAQSIANIELRLEGDKGLRRELIAELARAKPGTEADTQAAIAEVDLGIAAKESQLLNLRQARELLVESESEASKAEALDRLRATRREVDELGVEIEKDLDQLLRAIERLHPILHRLQAHGDDRAAAVYAVLRACTGDAVDRHYQPILSSIRGEHARGIIIDALYACGLGRSGMTLHPWVEVTPARSTESIYNVLQRARNVVRLTVDKQLKLAGIDLKGAAQ